MAGLLQQFCAFAYTDAFQQFQINTRFLPFIRFDLIVHAVNENPDEIPADAFAVTAAPGE